MSDAQRRSSADLTICSVSFDSTFYLDLNQRLVQRLNTSDNWRWLIVENSASHAADAVSGDDRVSVVAGGPPDPSIDSRIRGSYHHAAALNSILSHVSTRFVLLLDPDFYIVRSEWIGEILNDMMDRNLAFFGVPWHPRWYTKYRYFPCVHCLFIDLERVRRETLDFTPEIRIKARKVPKDVRPATNGRASIGGRQVHRIAKRLRPAVTNAHAVVSLRDRKSIGGSFDTGYKVFRIYGERRETPFDTAVPVYRPAVDLPGPRYATWSVNRIAEMFLADERCFIPKHRGAFTSKGFSSFGYPDARSLGWEEFVWRDRPFGFHVRRHRQDPARIEEQQRALTEVIDAL